MATGLLLLLSVLLLSGASFETLARLRNQKAFPPAGGFLDIDGMRMHYACGGAQSDVTLVLEAGAGGGILDWSAVRPMLEARVRVCAYDRAGLGWSEAGSRPRDAQAASKEHNALLDAAGIDGPVVAIGHSYGGLLAQYFARQHRDRVKGLVLIEPLHPSFYEKYAAQTKHQAILLRIGAVAATFGLPRLLGLAAAPASAPEETRKAMLARAYEPVTLRTIANEAAAVKQSIRLLDDLDPLPADFPVTIISRNPGSAPKALESDWAESQAKLSELTDATEHITTESTEHHLQFAETDLVVRETFALLTRAKL